MSSTPRPAPAGRVIIITGASSGIGRCTAQLFGRSGWRVGLIARGEAGLRSIADEIGPAAAMQVADVTDAAGLEQAAVALELALGPVEVWVNCAGNGVFGRFMDVPEAEFRRVTDVTYLGTANGTRVALRRMLARNAGTVVNICSAIAFHGLPFLSSYSGAKHAVRGFTDSVRHELEQQGSAVGLTTIYPPAVNTPFFSAAVTYMPKPPRPARPVYQPEVVADAVLLAATQRRREIQVSGITAVFALSCRLVPPLIRQAIRRLGPEGQMTDSPEAARRYHPTLTEPALAAGGTHGPFDDESRGRSLQMWASWRRARLLAGGLVIAGGAVLLVLWR
jgi:short-subunit dehydrogenase